MPLNSKFHKRGTYIKIMSLILISFVDFTLQHDIDNNTNNNTEPNKDRYHHFFQIFNTFNSMYSVLYNIIQLALDVFLIPFHLILFFYDFGVFNFIITNVLNTGCKLVTSTIPTGIYFSFSFFLQLIEFLFYSITHLLSALYVLVYLSFNAINFVIYGLDYIYMNFSGNSKSLFFNDETNETSFYGFILNLFNPKFVWNNFGLLSIIVFSLEIHFLSILFSLIKKIKAPVNYLITRFCKRRVRTDLFNQYRGNYEKIFESDSFKKEKITQQACFICLDDFSADVDYDIIEYSRIKNKVNELMLNNSWSLKDRLREKFDNENKLIKLNCAHFYHGSCIGDYIHFNKESRNSMKCPSCRSSL